MSNVCCVTLGFPGVVQWFTHGKEEGLWDLVVLDGSGKEEIPMAPVFVLGAWHPMYLKLVPYLRQRDASCRIYAGWSSSPFEMESAEIVKDNQQRIRVDFELIAFAAFMKELTRPVGERMVDGVGCLHPGLAGLLPGGLGFHLPAPVHIGENVPFTEPGERRGIGAFGPDGSKKAIVAQLMAVAKLQKAGFAESLVTNWVRYTPFIQALGIKAEIVDWEPDHRKHLERLSKVRAVLSASVGESWCYGALDAASCGIPVVASETVPWVPPMWRVGNPNDPDQIARKVQGFVDGTGQGVGVDARKWVEKVAAEQNAKVRTVVAQLELGRWPAR